MAPEVPFEKHKRLIKNYWLNSRFQRKYIFWISFSGLALIGANTAVFFFFTRQNYNLLVALSPMTDEAKVQLFSELSTIVAYLVGSDLLFLAITGVIGVLFSHRVAGTMYHFKRIFEENKTGKMTARIHLRPKDDFKDVAFEFNDMMDSIQGKEKSGS